MKSRFRPAHLAKLHMLAGPLATIGKNELKENILDYYIRIYYILLSLQNNLKKI
jgi:hypothetical protein